MCARWPWVVQLGWTRLGSCAVMELFFRESWEYALLAQEVDPSGLALRSRVSRLFRCIEQLDTQHCGRFSQHWSLYFLHDWRILECCEFLRNFHCYPRYLQSLLSYNYRQDYLWAVLLVLNLCKGCSSIILWYCFRGAHWCNCLGQGVICWYLRLRSYVCLCCLFFGLFRIQQGQSGRVCQW